MRLIWGLPGSEGLGGEMLFFASCFLTISYWKEKRGRRFAALKGFVLFDITETLAVTFSREVTLDDLLII